MFKLARIVKNYEEAGALNGQINLYGFLSDSVFLTKSGELGIILEVRGLDYECLDGPSVDALTKRLESAFRLFDENYRIYQYLFKRSNPGIPYKLYGSAIVDAAILNRIRYLESKSDKLFSLTLFYVVLFEGSRTARTIASVLAEIPERPLEALGELRAWFSTQKQIVLQERELSRAESLFLQKTHSFLLQVQDFVSVRIVSKEDAFRVLTQLLNFAPQKLEHARLKHDTFLDYYVCASHLECHRGHLRVDDYYVKVLTLKEPSAQSFPLILKRLLEVQANFHVVTEWKKEDPGKTRRVIQAKRRHFHNSKRSFFSQVNLNDAPAQDVLLDDSKESQVRELGEGIKEIELHGNYFGQFSLTAVVYDLDRAAVESASAEFYKVFSVHDAQLYEERYNLLNAFLAAVPGNHAFNLRYLYLLNTNYADYSFLFTLDPGHPRNAHLRQEYLAVLETNHGTPYFLNLHHRDVAHSLVLGRTGVGKTSLLNAMARLIPEDERLLLIEDTAEIQIHHPNLVRLEARPAQNGVPAVAVRDLLKAALRHRPDRILLGEVRGSEAFDLLQLLNTGHAGTISTIHANSAREGLSRFTSCVLQSGIEIPYRAIKSCIADSLNIVVHVERRPGLRTISEVVEVRGYHPDADVFDCRSIFQKQEVLP